MSLLATSIRNEKPDIRQWQVEGVCSLEIWDLVVGDGILWDWQDKSEFPEILLDALISLRNGSAFSKSKGAILPVLTGFDSVFVTGGRSLDTALRETLNTAEFPVHFSESPIFGSVESSLISRGEEVLAIDVGQTQIKIAYANQCSVFFRDLNALPLNPETGQSEFFCHYVCRSIREAISDSRPEEVVIALPCYVCDDLTLGGSSYGVTKRNSTLLDEIVRGSGLNGLPWLVLNDAEMAAVSAQQESALDGYKKTLILTLGFGVGACVWTRP